MQELDKVCVPRVVRVKQNLINAPLLDDIPSKVRKEIENTSFLSKIRRGDKVAVGVGSRGIDKLEEVVRAVVNLLKEIGAKPFIVPAMGSHGGATAEGQRQVLAAYGITEEKLGVPIISCMEVVEVGRTPEGVPIYFDKMSYQSDAVIAINRIKPHTEFSGEVESGILKMLTIGFGKHRGASTLHRYGAQNLPQLILQAARLVIEKAPIALGIALLEDGYGQLSEIKAMDPEDIEEEEKKLLRKQKDLMPRIPFPQIDLLLVDEMGKNISGAGLDTNIIGRKKPANTEIRYIVVRDLTRESHGNAAGIGLVDIITERIFKKIDFYATYINCLTSRTIETAKIPLVVKNDETAIKIALFLIDKDPKEVKMVRIKNTSKLEQLEISEGLVGEASDRLEIISDFFCYRFDAYGNLLEHGLELD